MGSLPPAGSRGKAPGHGSGEATVAKSFFAALHCMHRGIGDRKAVRLFACLSVRRVNCDETKAPSEKKFKVDY